MSAALADTGGPLAVNATIQLSMKTRTGLFSGTVKERQDASPALRSQLDNLAQLHARDAAGPPAGRPGIHILMNVKPITLLPRSTFIVVLAHALTRFVDHAVARRHRASDSRPCA